MTARPRRRSAALAALVVATLATEPASAQPSASAPADSAADVTRAIGLVEAGDYQRAAALARAVTARADAADADVTEAWRVLGLALFFLDRFADSEQAFLAYLKRDVEGRLDPGLVPPEALAFFEDVRSRHAAELRAYRRTPRSRWTTLAKFVPVAGQLQNGHNRKAWAIGVGAGVLVAANLASYALLRTWCDEATGVCTTGGGAPRADQARTAQRINVLSGVAIAGLYAYSVIDAFVSGPERRGPVVGVAPTADGAVVFIGGQL